mgnify:CR=1 FL=1
MTTMTALLRMLMGDETPDSGMIEKPDYATVGYLPQDGISVAGHSLREEAGKAFADVAALKEMIKRPPNSPPRRKKKASPAKAMAPRPEWNATPHRSAPPALRVSRPAPCRRASRRASAR